jgi:hypothetical protein
MPRENRSSFQICSVPLVLAGLVIISFVTITYFPLTTPAVLAVAVPVAAITLCLGWTSRPKTEEEGIPQRASSATRTTQQQPEETHAATEETPSSATKMTGHATTLGILNKPASPAPPSTQVDKERTSVENLQARISELEERVRSLREQLATGSPPEPTTSKPEVHGTPRQAPVADREEELSERALEQLLEALDEKLAKGTISQQLYQRLRDKYLARLSKARGKREAAPAVARDAPRRRR